MFHSRRSLKDEIVSLQYRVADLEERLCPCEQHDYIETSREYTDITILGDEVCKIHYKCRVCGKVINARSTC